MIISKTPFRISFFGGGTDYPEHFEKHGGAVLGTAIDKSAYVAATRFYSRLFDYCIRIAYREVECVHHLDEIRHAPFRECLRWCGISSDIEVDYAAELPSFSGLGTSSSFVVGLLNALYAFQEKVVGPMELAYQAIEIEREVLRDSVGCQDQVFAAMGGFNVVEFKTIRDISVHPVELPEERLLEFERHLMVFFSGIKRKAGEIAAKQIKKMEQNSGRLKRMREMVDEGYAIITGKGGLEPFGRLLHESWMLKSGLDDAIANGEIRSIYESGREAGAWGGKLLGAGGGGFILFFVPPEKRGALRERLKHLETVPIRLNAAGSHIINR